MMWVLWIKKYMEPCHEKNATLIFYKSNSTPVHAKKGSTVVFLENNAAFVGWPHENVLCFPEKK